MPFRWMALVLACCATVDAQSISLPARETLIYNIEWRLITAGKAKVEWTSTPRTGHVSLNIESVGLVSKLFRVEDSYAVNLGGGECAESSLFTSHEGSRQRETRITFDPAARKADYVERDRVKNTILLQKQTDIPPCVHDVVGGMYFLRRTLNLEPGQSTTVPVTDGKKSAAVRVEAQAREDVKTPEGVFHTIRYEVNLFNDVIFHRPAHLYMWFTDDSRRLPVQIRVRMQITIGTITLQLEKHE